MSDSEIGNIGKNRDNRGGIRGRLHFLKTRKTQLERDLGTTNRKIGKLQNLLGKKKTERRLRNRERELIEIKTEETNSNWTNLGKEITSRMNEAFNDLTETNTDRTKKDWSDEGTLDSGENPNIWESYFLGDLKDLPA